MIEQTPAPIQDGFPGIPPSLTSTAAPSPDDDHSDGPQGFFNAIEAGILAAPGIDPTHRSPHDRMADPDLPSAPRESSRKGVQR